MKYGISLSSEEITDWRLPIADTDIAREISLALQDPEYLQAMPAHRGAQTMVRRVFPRYVISVVTARPAATNSATAEWLVSHKLWFDSLVHVDEARKSQHAMNVLVDDYLGNILDFLRNTSGKAILVDRPWNRNRASLEKWRRENRLVVVTRLSEIPDMLKTMEGRGGRALSLSDQSLKEDNRDADHESEQDDIHELG